MNLAAGEGGNLNIKTEAGRNRTVPIHSAIRPLVESMMDGERPVFFSGKSVSQFRRDMKSTLRKLGLPERTPHSCRPHLQPPL